MRLLYSLALLSFLLLAAGCSAPSTTAPIAPSPAPAAAADLPALQVGTRLDAIGASTHVLEGEGWRWLDTPRPAFVEQMTYQRAHQYLPQMGDAVDLFPELPVWLVVYEGRWRLLPYGETQGAPAPTIYEGCVFVLLAAQDARVIAMGDAVCPSR